ncbi:MAG: RDD family protein [Burkholderiaceae bacterium]|jgi:uncharacterized RDD family membrane protein YckC|nr:RDD family protein [Burkholderiaceae bacterium]
MPPFASAGDPLDFLIAPSLGRRIAAWLYEGVLLFGVAFMANLIFAALTHGRGVLPAYRHPIQIFLFAIIGIYFVWCWSKGPGQTLAMKTWRIRAVDTRGQRLTGSHALWRYLLCWVWFLPPLAAAAWFKLPLAASAALCLIWVLIWALASRLRPDRQFWHDVWAGTRLVNADPVRAAAPPTF